MTDKKQKNWFLRHKILSVIGALVIVGIITSAANGSNNSSSTSGNGSNPTSNSLAKIGQPASDGKFTFIVNKLTCGISTVGVDSYAQATAQGQFCDLNLTIKNTGNVSQDLSDSNQSLYDAQGQKFSADSAADIYAEPSSAAGTWLDSINPGNSVTGDIYFDIPKGATPTTAELHDSAFSNGVKVSLQ